MSRREYKELSCREIGMDCDFLVRAATWDEAMRLTTEHMCEVHKICEITPEFKDKLTNSIRDIWCQEDQCGYAHWGMESSYYWG